MKALYKFPLFAILLTILLIGAAARMKQSWRAEDKRKGKRILLAEDYMMPFLL